MTDCTFDIALEHLLRLNLSTQDLVAIKEHADKEDVEWKQRREKSRQKEEERKANYEKMSEEEYAAYMEKYNASFFMSASEAKKENKKEIEALPEPVRRVYNMTKNKYYKDRRLCYSNEYYYGTVMMVALHYLIEKNITGTSSYEIAQEVIKENKALIDSKVFARYGNSIYPDSVYEEFKKRVQALNADFVWHREDGDNPMFDTFCTAFHYGQEITEEQIANNQPRRPAFLWRLFSNMKFSIIFHVYCSIAIIIWYVLSFIAGGIIYLSNPTQLFVAKSAINSWVSKNFIHYHIIMLIVSSIINWLIIFRHLV